MLTRAYSRNRYESSDALILPSSYKVARHVEEIYASLKVLAFLISPTLTPEMFSRIPVRCEAQSLPSFADAILNLRPDYCAAGIQRQHSPAS